MSKPQIVSRTAAEIDAVFETAFANVVPESPAKEPTLRDQVKPYRKAVLRQRKRGVSWRQIAKVMAQPPISVPVGETLLRRLFAASESAKPAVRKEPPALRDIRDPHTKEVIARVDKGGHIEQVPNSGPSPMSPAEEQRFGPLLDGLIPPIVKCKLSRSDARSYANNAVEDWKPADSERFHAILVSELDGLNETNCGAYQLTPDLIAPFKRKWNQPR